MTKRQHPEIVTFSNIKDDLRYMRQSHKFGIVLNKCDNLIKTGLSTFIEK